MYLVVGMHSALAEWHANVACALHWRTRRQWQWLLATDSETRVANSCIGVHPWLGATCNELHWALALMCIVALALGIGIDVHCHSGFALPVRHWHICGSCIGHLQDVYHALGIDVHVTLALALSLWLLH